MKLHLAISLLVLLATPSCKKAKGLLSRIKKPAATSAASIAASSVPMTQDLDAAGYDSFVATTGRLMVVDFHADWCGPCKMLGPVLEQVTGEFSGKVALGKVNVDHLAEIARREGVRGIPDVRLFRDGKEVDRFVGALDAEQVRALFQKHSEGLQEVKQEATPGSPATGATEPLMQPMKKDWMPPGMERR